jgi:hypothetical protein
VTLSFNDRLSLESFRSDERIVDLYLSNAWGKRSLERDALRMKLSNADERGSIPDDMFTQVDI